MPLHPPWNAVDSVFGVIYRCRRCEGPLTTNLDRGTPSEDECPGCGAVIKFYDDEGIRLAMKELPADVQAHFKQHMALLKKYGKSKFEGWESEMLST